MKFELDSYLSPGAVEMIPASRKCALFRDNKHAEKCLPLSIANTIGWEFLCPDGVTITWDGGPSEEALTVVFDHPERWATARTDTSRPQPFAKSHFATGVVTFDIGRLLRTPPGWSLMVTGKPNDYRDGIYPLTGVIETDWLDYTFTMNWKMTRPGTVRFEQGEAFAFVTPIQIAPIVECQPVEHSLADHPELAGNVRAGAIERDQLMARLKARDPETVKHPWGRRYWLGQQPEGSTAPAPAVHYNKVRTKPNLVAPKPDLPGLDQDGRLPADIRVRTLQSAAEAASLGILMLEGVLSETFCDTLIGVYDASTGMIGKGKPRASDFWRERLLGVEAVSAVAPDVAKRMREVAQIGIRHIGEFYRAPHALYADVLDLAKWTEGDFMAVHADNAYRDGRPHDLAHRAFSGLFYLSDDFEGGGLYLPRQNVVIRPRRGTFLSLPAGLSHEHGVVRVERGSRYTMPFFVTPDPAKASPGVHPRAAAPAASWVTSNIGAANFGLKATKVVAE